MKKTKTILRVLSFWTAIVMIISFTNRILFRLAGKRKPAAREYHFFDWSYGKIRYTSGGFGEPLLLVHGLSLGCGMHEWDACFDALSRRYKVYALDLAGCGGSDKPNLSYSSYLFAELLNDFVKDVIGSGAVYALGSSHSAAFLCAAAALEPENYKKLLLISPVGAGDTGKTPSKTQSYLKRLLDMPIIGTAIYNYSSSRSRIRFMLSEEYVSEGRDVAALAKLHHYYAHKGGSNARLLYSALTTSFLNIGLEEIFTKLSQPVHIIWGDKNKPNPIDNLYRLTIIPGNTNYSIYEECKQLPHLDYYERFAAECSAFFG